MSRNLCDFTVMHNVVWIIFTNGEESNYEIGIYYVNRLLFAQKIIVYKFKKVIKKKLHVMT
jgi:hypothetical protein